MIKCLKIVFFSSKIEIDYPRWIPGMSRDHPACEVPPGCCCDSCYPCDYDTDHVIAKAISQKNGNKTVR